LFCGVRRHRAALPNSSDNLVVTVWKKAAYGVGAGPDLDLRPVEPDTPGTGFDAADLWTLAADGR
jgi:hypothetical protein